MSEQRFLVTITDDETDEATMNGLLENYYEDVYVKQLGSNE